MINIQDFLQAVFPMTPPARPTLFTAWVTPKGREPRYMCIRAASAARARLLVMRVSARRYPDGFTFRVRPA